MESFVIFFNSQFHLTEKILIESVLIGKYKLITPTI